MLAKTISRRRVLRSVVLSIGLLIVICGSAWLWSRRSNLSPVYTVTAAGPLNHVAISADGHVVATAAANGKIQLWRAADGSPLRSLAGHAGPAAIAFSPESTQLVSAGEDGTVRLWQVASSQPHTSLWPSAQAESSRTEGVPVPQIRAGDPFTVVTFSPDGQLIAAGTGHGWVVIFQAITGQVVHIFQAYPELAERPPHPMEFIAVSPNNQWLLTHALVHLKLWHLPDRQLIQDFGFKQIHNVPYYPRRGVFTADTTQVWLFDDGGAQINATPLIWSLERQALLPAQPGLEPNMEEFTESDQAISSAISTDKQTLAFGSGIRHYPANYGIPSFMDGNDPRILVWRVGQNQPLYALRGHRDNVTDLALSADGHLLASVSLDGTLKLWQIANT